MELFCLRVSRSKAGKVFPFDRIYLVNFDERSVIEKLFRYSLVLPVEERLLKMLIDVEPKKYLNRTFHRNDAEMTGNSLTSKDWKKLIEDGQWVMVVPVLPKWIKKNMPRYLTAENWFAQRYSHSKKKGKQPKPVNESPFSNMAYLQTPDKKIRPVCVACPRFILHQNGECKLGDEVCFEALPLSVINHFDEGMGIPDAPRNVNEPEEYAIVDELPEEPDVESPPASKAKDLLRIIHE